MEVFRLLLRSVSEFFTVFQSAWLRGEKAAPAGAESRALGGAVSPLVEAAREGGRERARGALAAALPSRAACHS